MFSSSPRLQILLACHTKLVEPSLTSKQTLNGDLVKKLFHQKSIYVRPDKVILCEDNESVSNPDHFSKCMYFHKMRVKKAKMDFKLP